MSQLVESTTLIDEDSSVLDAAFALIDDYDEPERDCFNPGSSAPLKSVHNQSEVLKVANQPQGHRSASTSISMATKKQFNISEACSSTFQCQWKAEKLVLRDEAAVLQIRLRNLRQQRDKVWEKCLARLMRRSIDRTADKCQVKRQLIHATWCEQARKQYRLRLQSEKRNLELRANLDHQIRLNGIILASLRKRFITLGSK